MANVTSSNIDSIKRVALYAKIGGHYEDALVNVKCMLELIRDLATKYGYQVVKSYGDYGCKNNNGIGDYGGFNQLMKDAKKGAFDLIITMSIMRFASNTVKTIEIVNELKKLGIEVYFEKEKIHSFSPNAEHILNLIYSMSKEEQTSILEVSKKWQK